MRCRNCARLLLCCAALTLLAGCGLDALTYLRTLGATLSPAVPAAPFAPTLRPPGPLQLDIPPDNLEGLDFVALRGCTVQATVLKYNSSLGRAAKPSQRLLLALEYLDRAPACIARLRRSNNEALADQVADAWQRRREQLPALVFNATLGSDEYTAFWLPAPALGQYPRVDRRSTAAALAAINDDVRRWLGGVYRAQNRELELLLSEVAGGVGGARIEQHYQQLFPPIAALEAQVNSVLPQRYRRWLEERDEQLAKVACSKPKN